MAALFALLLAAAPAPVAAHFDHADAASALQMLGTFTQRKVVQAGCKGRQVTFSTPPLAGKELIDAVAKALDATIRDDGRKLVATCPAAFRDARAPEMFKYLAMRFGQSFGVDPACAKLRVTVQFSADQSQEQAFAAAAHALDGAFVQQGSELFARCH